MSGTVRVGHEIEGEVIAVGPGAKGKVKVFRKGGMPLSTPTLKFESIFEKSLYNKIYHNVWYQIGQSYAIYPWGGCGACLDCQAGIENHCEKKHERDLGNGKNLVRRSFPSAFGIPISFFIIL